MKQVLRALYKGWMKFAHVLGTVNMYILLTLFFVLLAPLGIALRIKRMIDDRKKVPSFWHLKPHEEPTIEHLRRTF